MEVIELTSWVVVCECRWNRYAVSSKYDLLSYIRNWCFTTVNYWPPYQKFKICDIQWSDFLCNSCIMVIIDCKLQECMSGQSVTAVNASKNELHLGVGGGGFAHKIYVVSRDELWCFRECTFCCPRRLVYNIQWLSNHHSPLPQTILTNPMGLIIQTLYTVLPVFATRVAACTGGVRMSFMQPHPRLL